MPLTFASVFIKPFFCSLADRKRSHRDLFIIFLAISFISFGSFGILPLFMTELVGEQLHLGRWILVGIMLALAQFSMAIITCLSDTFAVNYAQRHKSSYGLIRVWGTVGWGLSALIITFANQSTALPYLVPGLFLTIITLLIDLVLCQSWPNKQDFVIDESCSGQTTEELVRQINTGAIASNELKESTHQDNQDRSIEMPRRIQYDAIDTQPQATDQDEIGFKIQFYLFKSVAILRPSIFRYIFLYVLVGALSVLQWHYSFSYFTRLYGETDANYFSAISMMSQAVCGELPFFILAQPIINIVGSSHALSLAVISIGFRYLMYVYVLPYSGYFTLAAELFQGPSFGLFYVVMTTISFDYSDCDDAIISIINKRLVQNDNEKIDKLRHSLRSLMIAIASASYEGLGAGIGAMIGGFVIETYDYPKLWLSAAILAIVSGVLNSAIDLIAIPIMKRRQRDNNISIQTT